MGVEESTMRSCADSAEVTVANGTGTLRYATVPSDLLGRHTYLALQSCKKVILLLERFVPYVSRKSQRDK